MSKNTLRPTLSINISQRLAMTPSLLQKIELLTLNQLELCDLMTQELVKNPFLEEVADGSDPDAAKETPQEEKAVSEGENSLDDFDYEYFLGDYLSPPPKSREYEIPDDRPTFELFLSNSTSLADHLIWQLNMMEVPDDLREVVDFLVGNINEDGYLTLSVEEAAAGLLIDVATVEEALRLVQSLDPPGVGARDLQECLLIQLHFDDLGGSLAEELILHHLALLERKKYKEIARQLGVEISEIAQAMEVLRRLSPRPGQKYNSREPYYIRPDVYIVKVEDEYRVDLNDDGLPHLRLNRAYKRLLLKDQGVSKDTKSFVKERFRSALELIRSIDQRQQTIFRVCRAIIDRQEEFLEQGREYLRPMLIKDIASELGVHPSTVSRVVSNKYAHTPQGVIELRRFFTVGVEGANGVNVSAVHVKERMRKIIDGEDEKKPLSDQTIAKLLSEQGINITRRTVAKYRDQMHIAGSRERKQSLLQ